MAVSSDSASVMLDLKDFFLDTLVERIETLRKTLAGELTPGSDIEAALRQVAHGIRGAGGTYGFPELSELAETVELAPFETLRDRAETLVVELIRLTRSAGSQQIRVLLIEGDEDAACGILAALSSPSRSIRHVRSAAEASQLLYDEIFQLIVLDIALPDQDGRNLLLRLSEQFRTSSVPVFVVSDTIDPRLHAECLKLGAQQFFHKGVDAQVLSAAATGAIERAEHATRTSTLDPLTGLPNRAGFHATLQHAASICSRSEEPLCLAVLDLDRFKAINDTHGHLVGDQVLRRVAAVLQGLTRKADYVARWGGEEFVALFYGSRLEGATMALERIREKVKQELFETRDGTEFRVSFSAGIVEIEPGAETETAIAEADRLLYEAKRTGRDRIVNPETVVEAPRLNVLLVEDDALVAAAVERILRDNGYDIVHRSSSEAALEAVDDHDIALGILDVNMPGMDGFELLAKLRRLPKLQGTPLIMLTGRGEEHDVVRGFELGADDYVVKPFSAPTLTARVDRLARRC